MLELHGFIRRRGSRAGNRLCSVEIVKGVIRCIGSRDVVLCIICCIDYLNALGANQYCAPFCVELKFLLDPETSLLMIRVL